MKEVGHRNISATSAFFIFFGGRGLWLSSQKMSHQGLSWFCGAQGKVLEWCQCFHVGCQDRSPSCPIWSIVSPFGLQVLLCLVPFHPVCFSLRPGLPHAWTGYVCSGNHITLPPWVWGLSSLPQYSVGYTPMLIKSSCVCFSVLGLVLHICSYLSMFVFISVLILCNLCFLYLQMFGYLSMSHVCFLFSPRHQGICACPCPVPLSVIVCKYWKWLCCRH